MRQHKVDLRRLRDLIGKFNRAQIVVVGDCIVDHYVFGKVARISPEAPVPVVGFQEEKRHLGGAANVAHNIRELGGKVELAGAVGEDEPGEWMARRLEEIDISAEGLLRLSDRPTTIKTRVVAHNQQVVRLDRESCEKLSMGKSGDLTAYLERILRPEKVVVISDYGKGVICRPVLEYLRKKCRGGCKVCVDPKSKNFSIYKGFTLVTPNQHEAESASHVDIRDEKSLKKAAAKLLRTLGSQALLITRGEAGMALFSGGHAIYIPTMAREVYDVTGAGDTVLACLALSLSVGASFLEAAILANLAAGIVVGEVGTATIDKKELKAAVKEVLPYVRNKGN